ncbi:MAG: SDR family NAD(P)-dependent oxidoreductase, partial [Acidobacteriota bacterium]|nr:SDR family NAD(P)-dependent oxidoreductase [Acidobacteriota bacterium]
MLTKEESHPDEAAAEFTRNLRAAAALLESIVTDRGLLSRVPADDRRRLLDAAGKVYNPDVTARRRMVKATIRRRKAERTRRDDEVLSGTGIRTLRRQPVFTTPNVLPPADGQGLLEHSARSGSFAAQNCYICKQDYSHIHHFYDQLCAACAEVNFRKRTELADLRGRVALLSGGRVKIGYQAGLKLLRAGARLIVTTRFPRDAAARYAQEPDFEHWHDRLEIFGLDLRHTPSVEAFCTELLAGRDRLDFIINNACQTVRRPPAFYEHMMAAEAASLAGMPDRVRRLVGAY